MMSRVEQSLKGMPRPACVLKKPVLQIGLQLYLNAFFELSSERPNGFSLGRIPWSSVKMYAEFYRFDREQTQHLFYFINKMDAAVLKKAGESDG